MVTLLLAVYGILMVMTAFWVIRLLRSNRHFRTVIQHPSLTPYIK